MYWIWKSDSELKSKVGMQYALYLSSESVPFDDSIEKLLKSGKVKQIIHLMWFGKAIAVLKPGAIVDGVTKGEEAVVLNLENSAWKVRCWGPGFAQEVRRVEKQIGIEPSNNVPIKVEGEVQLWPQNAKSASNSSRCASPSAVQRRELRTAAQNSERKKPETSSTNSSTIFLSGFFNFDKFCEKHLKGVNKEKFSESETKQIKVNHQWAFLISRYVLPFLFILAGVNMYRYWLIAKEFDSKSEKQYATFLSSESIPFDDCIEKLLKSGKVTQIIHLPHLEKALAVLNPGAVIRGVTSTVTHFTEIPGHEEGLGVLSTGAVVDGVKMRQEVVVLNLENSALTSGHDFIEQVRRVEKQIGIEPSHEVPIKVVEKLGYLGDHMDETWAEIITFLAGVFFILKYRKHIREARAMIQGKLRV
ncbi:hypothetical protein Ddc_18277 [Ditylenchus destructor]|nr:hypothetical protein Ddc_18277 [Ditylenchus destructor]